MKRGPSILAEGVQPSGEWGGRRALSSQDSALGTASAPCTPHWTALEFSSSLESAGHGQVVGIFEVAADWNAHRDARDPHAERLQQPRQVNGSGLAFDRRVGGED